MGIIIGCGIAFLGCISKVSKLTIPCLIGLIAISFFLWDVRKVVYELPMLKINSFNMDTAQISLAMLFDAFLAWSKTKPVIGISVILSTLVNIFLLVKALLYQN